LAQRESCDCLESPAERREQVIGDFYQTHASSEGAASSSSSSSKVSDLAKKASTSGKMAALMRKLVAKYPDSIEKVEPPAAGEEEFKLDEFVKDL
jgi:hypothetical protein